MIYFIRNTHDGLIKIGYSAVPDARLKQLQTSTPYRLEMIGTIEGDITLERKLHAQLASERVGMEWFKNSERTLREIDLLLNPFPILDGKMIQFVYLAGKISGTKWRDEIMSTWSQSGRKQPGDSWWEPETIPVPGRQSIHCSGPFLCMLDHGGHCYDALGPHQYGETREYMEHGTEEWISTDRARVMSKIKTAIDHSDLVFAWLDSPECYGTLVEIGLAVGMGKPVVVAAPFENRELWVAFSVAKRIIAKSPKEAWIKTMQGEAVAIYPGEMIDDVLDGNRNEEPYDFGDVGSTNYLGIYLPDEDLN